MAIGWQKSSIIGGPLDYDVRKQLSERQGLYTKRSGRTDKELLYLNSKTGWIKLSSSVNVLKGDDDKTGSSRLAKNNILFGGTYKDKSTTPKTGLHGIGDGTKKTDAAYQKFSSIGFRPMPGINSFTIQAKNRFGTLRVAEISFQTWSVEQLTEMESLYLRPGFSVLIEWGHTIYLDNKGKVKTSKPKTVSDFFNTNQSKDKIQDKIDVLKKKYKGNYDGVLGFIKNFSWSYRSDGGYDCSLSVVSLGELIESVKISLSPAENGLTINENTGENQSNKTPIHLFFETIKSVSLTRTATSGGYRSIQDINSDIDSALKARCNGLLEKYKSYTGESQFKIVPYELKDAGSTTAGDNENVRNIDGFRYIKFHNLLALINSVYMLEDDNKAKLFDFSLDIAKSLFYTFPDHLCIDPGVAVLPKDSFFEETKLKYDIVDRISSTFVCTEDVNGDNTVQLGSKSILNFHLNIDFILESLDFVNNKLEQDRTVLAFIETILNKLTVNLGNINDFGLHYEEDEYRYYIVDRKLTPNDYDLSNSEINLTGLKATVSRVSLSSRLSPNIAKMIAVSAQAASTDVGEDAENMFRWNKGLVDRIVTQRVIPQVETIDNTKKVLNMAAKIGRHVGTFNSVGSYNPKDYGGLINIHKDLMTYLSIRYNKKETKYSAPGIIPFDLEITLDGLSGIKIGQAFTINKGILPTKYDGQVGFLVTGLSHTIQNNKWNTDLKAQTIILGKGDPLPEGETYDDISENVLSEILTTGKIMGDPNLPFEIVNYATDGTDKVDESTYGQVISKDHFMKNFINQNPTIQTRFGAFLDVLYAQYGGYQIHLTSTLRSYQRSVELYDGGKGPGTIPGKSPHNYGGGIDFTVKLPDSAGGTMIVKSDSPDLWETVTEIPQRAQEVGLYWAGRQQLGDGVYDTVHFQVTDFNYKETYKEVVANFKYTVKGSSGLTEGQKFKQLFGTTFAQQKLFGALGTEPPGKRLVPRGQSSRVANNQERQMYDALDNIEERVDGSSKKPFNAGDYIETADFGGSMKI